MIIVNYRKLIFYTQAIEGNETIAHDICALHALDLII